MQLPATIENQQPLAQISKDSHKSGITYDQWVHLCRRVYLESALEVAEGNRCKAARKSGIHRNTLARQVTELKIDAQQFKDRKPVRSVAMPRALAATEKLA